MNIEKHAYKVVSGFKKSLTPEKVEAIGLESFEELQILVEAALGETVSSALTKTADELEAVLKKTRKRTNSIQKLDD